MFEVEEEWDDKASPGTENLHEALFGKETAPLLKRLKKSRRYSLATDEKPVTADDSSLKSITKDRSKSLSFSPKRYSMLHGESTPHLATTLPVSTTGLKGMLHSKVSSKISGARFRWINEQLYTKTGEEARHMFEQNPSLFDIYHKGFTAQISKWPVNPLDRIISYVLNLPSSAVIADFGCGEAKLAQNVPNTVYSFDFVAANNYVTPCDMANIPLSNSSVDVCVFCLSLMGTNISEFIKEARRVLKNKGKLKICEIASRFASEEDFSSQVGSIGFELISKQQFSKLFLDFEFKAKKTKSSTKLPDIELKPCMYKRR